jgi:hypothetical protein
MGLNWTYTICAGQYLSYDGLPSSNRNTGLSETDIHVRNCAQRLEYAKSIQRLLQVCPIPPADIGRFSIPR